LFSVHATPTYIVINGLSYIADDLSLSLLLFLMFQRGVASPPHGSANVLGVLAQKAVLHGIIDIYNVL
jgi:hypothetical protein